MDFLQTENKLGQFIGMKALEYAGSWQQLAVSQQIMYNNLYPEFATDIDDAKIFLTQLCFSYLSTPVGGIGLEYFTDSIDGKNVKFINRNDANTTINQYQFLKKPAVFINDFHKLTSFVDDMFFFNLLYNGHIEPEEYYCDSIDQFYDYFNNKDKNDILVSSMIIDHNYNSAGHFMIKYNNKPNKINRDIEYYRHSLFHKKAISFNKSNVLVYFAFPIVYNEGEMHSILGVSSIKMGQAKIYNFNF